MNDLATLQEGPNTNGRRERNHVDVTFAQDTSRCVSNRSISSKLLALSLTSGLLVRTLPCSRSLHPRASLRISIHTIPISRMSLSILPARSVAGTHEEAYPSLKSSKYKVTGA